MTTKLIKLFSDLYPSKFLNTSIKPSFYMFIS